MSGGCCVRLLVCSTILALIAVAQPATAGGTMSSGSLCGADETVLFSCSIKRASGNAIASLCSSKKLTRNRGYLQYRFGKQGRVELEFPREQNGSRGAFYFAHYFRPLVDLTEVRFVNDGYRYTLFAHFDDESKPAIHQSGVRVTALGGDAKPVEMTCSAAPLNHMARLAGILPCDKDSGLNTDTCAQ
jgi:hypothetical protein